MGVLHRNHRVFYFFFILWPERSFSLRVLGAYNPTIAVKLLDWGHTWAGPVVFS